MRVSSRKRRVALALGMAMSIVSLDLYGDEAPPPEVVPALEGQKPAAGWSDKDGFTIASPDGKFKLEVGGYFQLDSRSFLGDRGDLLVDQFQLRRARPKLEGTLYGHWDFRVMPDFALGKVVLQDAWVDAHYRDDVRVRIGKLKEPFGLERLQAATAFTFIERGAPTNLAPNRDLGVQLWGDFQKGRLSYAVGLFDGVPDGGSVDGDVDDSKDLVARVFGRPLAGVVPALADLGLGVAVSYGKRKSNLANPQVAPYKTSGQNTFFSYLAGATLDTTVIADGAQLRVSPQGYYYLGPFGLLGEWVLSRQRVTRGKQSAELSNRAWGVQASYVVTGDKASYKGVTPRHPLDPAEGHWGAVELAVRYNETRVDPDAFAGFADANKSARHARAFAGAVNWYASSAFRLVAVYERTSFLWGAAAGNRPTENLLGFRVQTVF